MEMAFTEEQLLFRDAVRDLLTDKCTAADVRAAWENDSGRVPGLWGQLAEMGVVGLTAPEAGGGLGMSMVDLVLLLEESGRAALPDPLADHTAVAIPALVEAGADDLVASAAAGDITIAVGLDAEFVPYGESADVLLLESNGELHAVPNDAVTATAHESIDGSRRLAAIDWTPSDATRLVGADAALAGDRAALAAAAQCIGITQHLLDATVEYVSERYQFGKPVGTYQAVKHHLANVGLKLEFARPVVYRAAWCLTADVPERGRDVSMAKALASDAVDFANRMALQCHGAIGYTYEYDLQLWMKKGWALAASHGDAAFHRGRVAAALDI